MNILRRNKKVLIISFVLAFILSFRASSLWALALYTLFVGIWIATLLELVIGIYKRITKKDDSSSTWKLTGNFILLAVLGLFFASIFLAGLPAITPAHFRTNIITGGCNFGGFSGQVKSDPWFYREGCDIDRDEKIELIKNSSIYKRVLEECNDSCTGQLKGCNVYSYRLERGPARFVDEEIVYGDSYSCSDIAP